MIERDRNSEAFVVRQAHGEDAAGMQQFLAELFAENLPVLFRKDVPPTVEEERSAVEALLVEPRSIFLIAAAGPKVVGVLDFHGSTKQQREHLGGFGVSVAKAWRRRGVATALLEQLEAWARSKQFRRIELEVFENNVGAFNLYKKLGYEVEGRRREAVEVDGALIDVITMAKAHLTAVQRMRMPPNLALQLTWQPDTPLARGRARGAPGATQLSFDVRRQFTAFAAFRSWPNSGPYVNLSR